MIGGVPFRTVAEREELMAHALKADTLLPDPPVQVLRSAPPLVLSSKDEGWQLRVQQAVRDGAVIQGSLRDDPEVARLVAQTSAKLHEDLALQARNTLVMIDSKTHS